MIRGFTFSDSPKDMEKLNTMLKEENVQKTDILHVSPRNLRGSVDQWFTLLYWKEEK